MTIPMSIPLGRRRLVVSMSLLAAQQTSSKSKLAGQRPDQFPEAIDATDHELAKLNQRAAAEADRRRWQAQAIFHGVRS